MMLRKFFLSSAPASHDAGLGRGASDIGPAREGPSAEALIADAQARREEMDVGPEQFQDPDNEYGLFAGTIHKQDDEADNIYEAVDQNMDVRRRARREARENAELAQHHAERSKIQQQSASCPSLPIRNGDIPEVGNLTRKTRRKDERTFVVPDSIIVGDRGKTEYESSVDTRQQQVRFIMVAHSRQDLITWLDQVRMEPARSSFNDPTFPQISGTSTASGSAASVDFNDYLTSLNSVVIESEIEIGDIRLRHVRQSIKIWLAAANLSKLLRTSTLRLWRESVNLETSPSNARMLLSRAVEIIPLPIELWLALARLETPEFCPTSHEIWIAAGRLLEQEATADPDKLVEARNKELDVVGKTIEAGARELRRHQVLLTRDQWLKEAERCETEASPAETRGTVGNAILAHALKVIPDKRNLRRKAADHEKVHGTRESLDAALAQAVHYCIQAEVLWSMSAKEKWLAGDAFVANPEREHIPLAALKLEAENGELGVARDLLVRARTVADTERIWMKSAVFERQQGRCDAALEMVSSCKFSKEQLWVLASKLEELDGKSIKVRATLEKGCLVNSTNEIPWAEAVGVEERSGGAAQAMAMLSRGLQELRSVVTEQYRNLGDDWACFFLSGIQYIVEVVKQLWQSIAKDDKNVGKGTKEIWSC
ncbi:hypothetical protein BS17DRAFT_796304 [Gyrodon lividus]|nr:hypothetical protein BS17DRAFT_796304 [Gyrodon lividus]